MPIKVRNPPQARENRNYSRKSYSETPYSRFCHSLSGPTQTSAPYRVLADYSGHESGSFLDYNPSPCMFQVVLPLNYLNI